MNFMTQRVYRISENFFSSSVKFSNCTRLIIGASATAPNVYNNKQLVLVNDERDRGGESYLILLFLNLLQSSWPRLFSFYI